MTLPPIELLAPAGCYPSLHAAIHNGADAVYFGLAQLNMRARSRRSFDLEDLGEICRICKDAKVKTNLALNTLLYEHDLSLARQILEQAVEHKVDAVILSDMAAVQIALELRLEVHLSTQLSISNLESVRFYAQFCNRIVLARELSLPMIRTITQGIQRDNIRGASGRLMEIEAFAHGALCVAVSGRCNMSLYTSNASANRGACEQNCRKEYKVTDVETGDEFIVDNNFVMSPTDIQTIDFLNEMLDSGVTVFKLEGRGRAPEYVGAVTAAYRKALDAHQSDTYTENLSRECKAELKKVYNRGTSSGYYLGKKQGWSNHAGSKATRRKDLVGTLKNVFTKSGVIEVDSSHLAFSLRDEYVIVGNTTGAVSGVAEELRMDSEGQPQSVQEVPRGAGFTMTHTGEARRGDKLYRLTPITPASQSSAFVNG